MITRQVTIDPATLTWDGDNQCWVWNSPAGVRYYEGDFSVEFDRAESPRKFKYTRSVDMPVVGRRGLQAVKPQWLIPALQAAGAVVAARHREMEAARRAIQVRRQAEQLEGVVVVTECANCGAPPPARGQPCRHCGTVPPG